MTTLIWVLPDKSMKRRMAQLFQCPIEPDCLLLVPVCEYSRILTSLSCPCHDDALSDTIAWERGAHGDATLSLNPCAKPFRRSIVCPQDPWSHNHPRQVREKCQLLLKSRNQNIEFFF